MKPRAVVYHRVSTLDQDRLLPRDELRSAVATRGFELVEEISEVGSGARNNRPGLQRVLALARSGAVDCVVVWKLDRFGRSALDLLTNLRTLEDAGVRFIATTQSIDVKPDGDAVSKLIVAVLAAIGEFERDLIRERTRLGIEKAKRLGRHLGRPVSLTSPGAENVFRLRRDGASWTEISRLLGCSIGAARRAVERGIPLRKGE